MFEFLGAVLNWQVLAIFVGALIVVFLLGKFLTKNNKIVQSVVEALEFADELIEFFMPEKYKQVYEALIFAAKSVVDGVFTQDEAIEVGRKAFKAALRTIDIELNEQEMAYVDKVLVFLVGILIKNKGEAVVAVANVVRVKGYSF